MIEDNLNQENMREQVKELAKENYPLVPQHKRKYP